MKAFLLNIKKQIVLYIIAILAATLGSVYIVKLINLPRNEQTFCFFLASYTVNTKPLQDKMMENRPSYLREIQMFSYEVTNDYLPSYFSVIGCTQSDLAIIPESKINNSLIKDNFTIMTKSVIEKYFTNAEYYELGNFKYGILVHKKGQIHQENLIAYCTNENNDENYYAFVRKNSLHAGEASGSEYYTSYEYINLIRGL